MFVTTPKHPLDSLKSNGHTKHLKLTILGKHRQLRNRLPDWKATDGSKPKGVQNQKSEEGGNSEGEEACFRRISGSLKTTVSETPRYTR